MQDYVLAPAMRGAPKSAWRKVYASDIVFRDRNRTKGNIMGSPAQINIKTGTLPSDGSNFTLRMTGPVMVLCGGTHLDTGIFVSGIGSNTAVKVGWRVGSTFSDSLGSWGSVSAPQGTARSSQGAYSEAFSMSGHSDKMFVQAGVFTAESGGTPQATDVQLACSVRGGGFLVARKTLVLPPASTTTVLPIGNPFPASGVVGLMFALRFTGVSGTIVVPTTKYRTFDSAHDMYPGAWTDVAAESNVTSDSSVNSAAGITTTGKVMAQAGIQYSTSGTSPYAVLDAVIAAQMA